MISQVELTRMTSN
jgi:20S proteasome alpha/beta subunit